MTETEGPVTSGFTLEKIYFPEQSYRLLDRTDDMPEEASLQFGWNWKLTENKLFEVMVHLTLGVSKARPEEIKVFVCGVFGVTGDPPTVALTDFVRLQGPAILLPYAREVITSMTGRSFFGPQYLPPLNVVKLMSKMNPDETIGAEQMKERELSGRKDPD